MSNIKLSGENILGMELADWNQTEAFGLQLDAAENVVFWGRGAQYKRVFQGIMNKEKGFDKWATLREFAADSNLNQGRISDTIRSYDVVVGLSQLGVKTEDLPKKEFHAMKLRTHPEKKQLAVWNKKGKDVEKYVEPAKKKGQKETDMAAERNVDAFIADSIYQIQNLGETLNKIQRLIDDGVKPKNKAKAVILTQALKELHGSLLELAGIGVKEAA